MRRPVWTHTVRPTLAQPRPGSCRRDLNLSVQGPGVLSSRPFTPSFYWHRWDNLWLVGAEATELHHPPPTSKGGVRERHRRELEWQGPVRVGAGLCPSGEEQSPCTSSRHTHNMHTQVTPTHTHTGPHPLLSTFVHTIMYSYTFPPLTNTAHASSFIPQYTHTLSICKLTYMSVQQHTHMHLHTRTHSPH